MPQIEYTEPPDPIKAPEAFKDWCWQIHLRILGIGSGTKGDLDGENIPNLDPDGAIVIHMDDTTIHFTQSSISITESQISDFGSYESANSNIQTTVTNYTNHAADTSIHYAKTEGEYHIPFIALGAVMTI